MNAAAIQQLFEKLDYELALTKEALRAAEKRAEDAEEENKRLAALVADCEAEHPPEPWAAELQRRAEDAIRERDEARAEVGKQGYALRTRPDYDFRCDRCGAPHNIDTSIPSSAWNVIVERESPGGDKYGALCCLCIDELLTEKGITAKAEFYFGGTSLSGKLYTESQGDVEYLQRTLAASQALTQRLIDGIIGQEQKQSVGTYCGFCGSDTMEDFHHDGCLMLLLPAALAGSPDHVAPAPAHVCTEACEISCHAREATASPAPERVCCFCGAGMAHGNFECPNSATILPAPPEEAAPQAQDSPELDSPNFKPQALKDLEARGFVRINDPRKK